ncbi:MAG: hypothetical protein L3J12_01065 [Spirochaetales bacterium]|nr:hypothetical protein [Spirochaetales bacterium]
MHSSDTVKKINPGSYNFQDIKYDSVSAIEFTSDMGLLAMGNQTNETFNDLIKRDTSGSGNLFYLSRLRYMMHDNGILNLINTFKGIIDDSYLARVRILLNKAGFIDIKIKTLSSPLVIQAVKRPPETEDIGYGLTLKEIIYPEEIFRCHEFAKDFYSYKDFNYDLEVVKQFDLNCDHFAVVDENDEIYCMARIVIRTPGHFCPFMYATIADDSTKSHVSIPGKDKRVGEVMAIYSEGKKGVVAFKRMMEYLTQYGTTIGHFDSVWTTYDNDDNYTGMYYKNKFKMKETGIKLQYSDFGGLWNLLVTEEISLLKNLHHQIFRHKQE